jgi:membrane protease subunit HflC
MKRRWIILILAALVIVAAVRSLIFVDETEAVIVTQFGRPVRTLERAGLYLKPPYQSVIRIDRRLQIYNPRPSEFLTSEKKNVDLDAFVCWKVGEPRRFLEAVNEFAGAEARIHDIVWSELAAEIGRSPLEALISVDPKVQRLAEIMAGVTASFSACGPSGREWFVGTAPKARRKR